MRSPRAAARYGRKPLRSDRESRTRWRIEPVGVPLHLLPQRGDPGRHPRSGGQKPPLGDLQVLQDDRLPLDDTVCLKALQPPPARRRAQAHALRQVLIGEAGVLLQFAPSPIPIVRMATLLGAKRGTVESRIKITP